MKITHVVLCGSYNDDWGYQDNLFPIANKRKGHQVSIITNCMIEKKNNSGVNLENQYCEYIDKNGIFIMRLPFRFPCLGKFNKNIRCYEGLYNKLREQKPDAIFVHNLQFWDIYKIAKFKKAYPSVAIYGDSHSDKNNSARTAFSKVVLHRWLYKKWILKNMWMFEHIYYIAYPTKDFLIEKYSLNEDKLTFLSLGGNMRSDEKYKSIRKIMREELDLENAITLLHTGKMDRKKKSLELLVELDRYLKENKASTLLIAGCFSDDIKEECLKIINQNDKMIFLGWKSNAELEEIMCASDILIQPGSLSVVFQIAICNRMVPILNNVENNRFLTSNNNGYVVNDIDEIVLKLNHLNDRELLGRMKKNSYEFAKKRLSYETQTEEVFGEEKCE